MQHTRSLIVVLAGLLLAAAGERAGADDSARLSSIWLDPVGFYRRAHAAVAGWQPPKVIQELIDIAVAKPLPPMDPRQFAGKSRFGWAWLKARFDTNQDGVITRQEFGQRGDFFDRLDRNHDGALRADDFDWSQQRGGGRGGMFGPGPGGPGPGGPGPGGPGPRGPGPGPGPGGRGPRPGPGGPGPGGPGPGGPGPGGPGPRGPGVSADQFVRAMDGDNNARISRDEWNRFFDKLANKKGYLTMDDISKEIFQAGQLAYRQRIRSERLRNLLRSKGPVDAARVDGLTLALVLLGQYWSPPPGNAVKGNRVPGKPAPGPEPGQEAPDFTLLAQDSRRKTSLADYRGRPVVLVFGSVASGPFRSRTGTLDELRTRYKDRVEFLSIYIREGGPRDAGGVKQPKTFAERCAAARLCSTALNVKMPVLVDGIDDRVMNAYRALPERLYLIDERGKVVYQGAQNPMGFRPDEMEQSLIMLLLERETAAGSPHGPAAVRPTEPARPR